MSNRFTISLAEDLAADIQLFLLDYELEGCLDIRDVTYNEIHEVLNDDNKRDVLRTFLKEVHLELIRANENQQEVAFEAKRLLNRIDDHYRLIASAA